MVADETAAHGSGEQIDVDPGDEVHILIRTTRPISATILYENLSTGQKVTVNAFPDFPEKSALRSMDAHWLVKNFQNVLGPVPPANFGQVKFTHMWGEN